ncbi:MAG: HIT family protein [Kiritimatiellia bacterium]
MPSIFTRIIQGRIPCEKIFENDRWISFLDIRPVMTGHALLVPKLEVDYLFDLPDDLLAEMLATARPVAAAIQKVVPCARIGLMVAGVDVPHVHLHLMPITGGGEMDFNNARPADPARLRELAGKIRAAF